jgi:hypothetical protein
MRAMLSAKAFADSNAGIAHRLELTDAQPLALALLRRPHHPSVMEWCDDVV